MEKPECQSEEWRMFGTGFGPANRRPCGVRGGLAPWSGLHEAQESNKDFNVETRGPAQRIARLVA